MRIRGAVERNVNELPGYNLLGYAEVAIPIFQRKLHVLALTQKSIPVVEEFVLNFYNEGLNLDEIKSVLGLEQQLIDEAWAGLIQRDYINHISREITESGTKYLGDNNVEQLEKVEFSISIDGMTGEISKFNNNLMVTETIKTKGIRSLKANIDKPDIQSLNFKSVKKVFNQYKESDKESYSGSMLDIVHMEGNTTKFRRVDILIFKNIEDDIRITAFDGFNRLDNYEEKLLELDGKGINLFKYNFEDYFNSKEVININTIIASDPKEDCKILEYKNVNESWENYLDERNGEIIIVTPLVSECNLTEGFIDKIEAKLKHGINIKFVISGRDFIGEYQKKIFKKLTQLSIKNKRLKVIQVPSYFNKMILNCDKKTALVSIYEENSIGLNGSKLGIVERFYELKNDLFQQICDSINEACKVDNKITFDLSGSNKAALKNKMENISRLVRDADGYIFSNDDIGWIGVGEVADIISFIGAPLAANGDKFRTFIDVVNKSLVESLDINSKKKYGRDYFWKDFQVRYPDLQKILDKIRTYRNRNNHLDLTQNNKKKYFDYLNEDLKGYMPEFIENGYLILQWKLLNELEIAIKKTINELK